MQKPPCIIDGKAMANAITTELALKIARERHRTGMRAPKLVVVLVGARKDSETYVRMKRRTANKIGIEFACVKLDEDIDQAAIEMVIRQIDADDAVDGIIVQLPLPDDIDAAAVTETISPSKDVDGFHPQNVGNLVLGGHRPFFVACTARGVIRMIKKTGLQLRGARVVLVGCGMVGKPLIMLLLRENATVMCCNKDTRDIAEITRMGDVIVAAAGKPNLVRKEWVKPGAVIIDVGINGVPDSSKKSGYKLVGDVDYEGVSSVASAISPVPGGVGPMTVAMLMTAVVEGWSK